MSNDSTETITGQVTNANERGFQLHGTAQWYNWSKFANEPRTYPSPGHNITATLDQTGFVRRVVIGNGALAQQQVTAPREATAPKPAGLPPAVRLECLRIAVEYRDAFTTSSGEQYSALALAEYIAMWVEGRTS